MQPIPSPELLDPDRTLSHDRDEMVMRDDRDRAQLLEDALHQSCEYAATLWHSLDQIRNYLFESLPSDPRAPGPHPSASAAPTGPDDDAGWEHWIAAYSAVTSVLTGPQGDSGYGHGEATRAARLRRDAPNVAVLTSTPLPASTPGQVHHPGATLRPPPPAPPVRNAARSLAIGALVALAVRGLRRAPRAG